MEWRVQGLAAAVEAVLLVGLLYGIAGFGLAVDVEAVVLVGLLYGVAGFGFSRSSGGGALGG